MNDDTIGRAWVFGDDIDTDVLAPGLYMRGGVEELAKHCLEAVDPTFATEVEPGDFIVAGRNFGAGSSREQAVQVLRHLGIVAVVARSFAGIFFRNAFNLGLPALVSADAATVAAGNRLSLDLTADRLIDQTEGRDLAFEPIPSNLRELIAAGGLVPLLEKRFETTAAGKSQ